MHDLLRLIASGENDRLDFKKTIKNPDKIARTMASFANTRGGIILVGVLDNGAIVGIDPEEEKHTLRQAAELYCKPPLHINFLEVEINSQTVLQVIIPESKSKPHLAKLNEGDWRGYVRVKDKSVQTSQIVLKAIETEPRTTYPIRELNLDEADYQLLGYLKRNDRVTLKQFINLADISKSRAYKILVKLVLHGYIRIHDKGGEPYYTLK